MSTQGSSGVTFPGTVYLQGLVTKPAKQLTQRVQFIETEVCLLFFFSSFFFFSPSRAHTLSL